MTDTLQELVDKSKLYSITGKSITVSMTAQNKDVAICIATMKDHRGKPTLTATVKYDKLSAKAESYYYAKRCMPAAQSTGIRDCNGVQDIAALLVLMLHRSSEVYLANTL